MLAWIKTENKNRWEGWSDGDLVLVVEYEEDWHKGKPAWSWCRIGYWDYGTGGFATAKKAMADATEDWKLEQERLAKLEQNSRHEPMFTPEEWDEILSDLLADERKEEKMGW